MIEPLVPPFEPDVAAQLEQMMPAGAPPIALFRTFAKNLPMTKAMRAWGSYELGRTLSLSLREREIVIDRTCARCGCEYEWGVHVAFFAAKAELTAAQITSLTHGEVSDACWASERERLLIETVDALHHTSDISDTLAERLARADRGRAARPVPARRLVPRHQLRGERRSGSARGGRATVRGTRQCG